MLVLTILIDGATTILEKLPSAIGSFSTTKTLETGSDAPSNRKSIFVEGVIISK